MPLRTALGAIVDGDATMQTLCGRATNLLVDWDSRHNATPPFIAVLLVVSVETRGSDYWEVLAQFECVAAADLSVVDQLGHRLGEIVTYPNLNTQGLDAAPIGLLRDRGRPATDELLQDGWVFKLLERELMVR